MNSFLILIFGVLMAQYIIDLLAEWLKIKHLQPELSPQFRGFYDKEKYKKSQFYIKDNSRLKIISSTGQTLLLIPFILLGGFNFIDRLARSFNYDIMITGCIFFFILIVISFLINLPLTIYKTFVIEEKYGFNRTKPKTFITDIIKGFFLLIILGGPLVYIILWFFTKTGTLAPFYVWIVIAVFQISIMFLSPLIIMPLFNKFTPLKNQELETELNKYAEKQNFKMKGIYVMDGSKRSAKTNAFFTGFGRSRRIVFLDTLIEKHTVPELVAILAHEMGHYKSKHILKMFALTFVETGILLLLLSIFINNKMLFAAFKMDHLSVYASLVFFGFLYIPFSMFLTIITNFFSRQMEYTADKFSLITTGQKENIILALKKLSVDNLSNLTPHKFNVILSHSHPPLIERLKAIEKS